MISWPSGFLRKIPGAGLPGDERGKPESARLPSGAGLL